MLGGVGKDAGDRGGKVFVGCDAAGLSFADDRGRTTVGSNDGGNPGGQSFEDYVAEGVGVRREDEEVHIGVGARERLTAQDAGKFGSGQMPAQPTLFGSLADDEEAKISDSTRNEPLLDLREEGDVLLYGKTADEAEDGGIISRPALTVGRRK